MTTMMSAITAIIPVLEVAELGAEVVITVVTVAADGGIIGVRLTSRLFV